MRYIAETLAALAIITSLATGVGAAPWSDEAAIPADELQPAVVRPDEQVEILSTLDSVRALTTKRQGRVRSEVVGDKYIIIVHDTTAHVGTLAGETLDYAQRALSLGPYAPNATASEVEKRQGGCVHDLCVLATQCGNKCSFCYPVLCYQG
ncbi:hypothetical protein GE09DRAFT_1209722 [Coniochaeta sp. 2T2.1]|nr:hypothetical protein GE09DRAFT_1209722 [Coniochaeta sp. 2T2.1]